MSNPAMLHRYGDHHWDDAFPLLPEQFAETARALEVAEPERRLLLAVLCDAIVVFQRRVVGPDVSPSRGTNEAERWILSDDRRWLYSFVNVCEALDLAHEPLRRALLDWRWRVRAARRSPAARRRLMAGKEPMVFADSA